MVLFVILAAMTVVTLVLLVSPLLRRHGEVAPRADYDLEIYRDQLRELERDVERGVIGPAERDSARLEIERRMLNAAPAGEAAGGRGATGPPRVIAAFAITIAIPLAAGSLYLGLGSPGLDDRPFAARQRLAPETAGDAAGPDVEAMVAGLAERLENEPDDLEGWIMLGRSYGVLGRYLEAVAALERARKLAGADPDLIASLAETRVLATGGVVSPAAIKDFETLQSLDPGHPAARFYLGLAHAQSGEYRVALDEWIAFARESPADAPWMDALREQITSVSETLGVPVPDGLEGVPVAAMSPAAPSPAGPGPTAEDIAVAQSMSSDEQSAMIRSMVGRLAERLEESPDDVEGWRRLGRSYGVLGEPDKARDAYARAAGLAPGDPAVLAEYAESIALAAPEGAPVPDQAVTVFLRLAGIDPANPVALWHLGLAEAQRGNPAEARAYWNRLLAALPAGSSDQAAVRGAIDRLGEAPAGG